MRSVPVLLAQLACLVALSHASGQSCGRGTPELTLGIVTRCTDCVVHASGTPEHWVQFRTPPTVVSVERGSRTSPQLVPGDSVVYVDARSILTDSAARQFSNPSSTRPVRLTIRRGKSELLVTVVPTARCAKSGG